jgi:hypothetical protein
MSREYTLQRAPHASSIKIDYAAELNEQQFAAVTGDPLLGHYQWDDLPAVLAIGPKVAVGGENNRVVSLLGHSDEARVGKAHGSVVIATEKTDRLSNLIGERKIDCDNRAFEQPAKSLFPTRSPVQKKKAFRNHRFTTDKWLALRLKMRARPGVMLITTAQRGDNRTAIDEDGFGHSF